MNLLEKALTKLGPLGAHAYYAHGYFAYPRLEGELGSHMMFNGKEKLVWSLNNYLGLANCPVVRKADEEGVKQYGLAYPMGARMMTGNSMLHELLEKKLSAFVSKQDTFLLNYGYQGMLSIIDSLVDRHDVIVYDSESHACIIDGCRLHAGKRFVFKHNDMADFEKQLDRAERLTAVSNGGILVITEGVFGMRGDMGKLKEIALLKKTHNFTLLVDDAHGIGVMGPTGAGTGEHQGVQDSIDLYFGTFAKSFAAIGAFVSGKKEIIQYLRYNMRSQIYAKSLPMPVVFGLHQRLQLIQSNPELRTKLWAVTKALQAGLRGAGLDIGNTESPVTPVYLSGSINQATRLVEDLRENHHIFCSMVVYPVIPQGIIILRLIPTAIHTPDHVQQTIAAFKVIKKNLSDGTYDAHEKPSYAADQILSSNLWQ
ncbi:aminotransferase class I/II-fold pyridoxal phosphate-dependent enzyme [Mucilaginibacter sp. 14171R-50]|uniref:aminotransferase class I/II-fold pyridoxal phosphate-dependent enzyme n=1 Tax=Mucilaginibacter sp. 14171R-50 TaxID=2703789 RepID=UPI00138BC4BF|nr:aminotransferase class I/II-fold pyridoxal phosphate-dependent enzyme [Mucilaginibacter sp. 14171R-50]QHS55954.1 aminotransferase class I/II-fold pyridoxal phosphate-dependent enzyme [Mucilaginibacter sp. 14171R-50]